MVKATTLTYNDLGVFIGLITAPNEKFNEFYQKEIKKNLFENYKANKLLPHLDIPKEGDSLYENHLYKQIGYCLLGKWDLLLLSLIDDTEFSLITFQSHRAVPGTGNDQENAVDLHTNFNYQTTSAFAPIVEYKKGNEDLKSCLLEEKWVELFESDESKKYPLVGICSLKINNSILLGSDLKVYKNIVANLHDICQAFKEELAKKGNEIDSLILETGSWNELTLLAFGTSYVSIGDLFEKIKKLTVGELGFTDILDKSFLKEFINKKNEGTEENSEQFDITNSHIFVSAIINMGFDISLYLNYTEILKDNCGSPLNDIADKMLSAIPGELKICNDDRLRFSQRWYTKPGHLEATINKIKKAGLLKKEELNYITQGNSSFTLYASDTPTSYFSSSDIVKHIMLSCHIDAIDNDIHQTLTILETQIEHQFDPDKKQNHKHTYIHKELKQLEFNTSELKFLQKNLKSLGVAKIISEKVYNLYAMFNESITDNVMYSYFLELKPTLAYMMRNIEYRTNKKTELIENKRYDIQYAAEIDIRLLNNYLNTFCDNFQKGYLNRFHQSHQMADISDYNFDFKGGTHQYLSAVNYVHTSFATYLSGHPTFAFLNSITGLYTGEYSICINLYHIYQPAIYISLALHEALNFAIGKGHFHFKGNEKINESYNIFEAALSRFKEEIYKAYKKENDPEKYFFIDWFVLHFGYNNNFDLFKEIHISQYLQAAESYSLTNSLHQLDLERIFLRLVFCYRLFQQIKKEEIANPAISYFFSEQIISSRQEENNKSCLNNPTNTLSDIINIIYDDGKKPLFEKLEKILIDLTGQYKQTENNSIINFDDYLQDLTGLNDKLPGNFNEDDYAKFFEQNFFTLLHFNNMFLNCFWENNRKIDDKRITYLANRNSSSLALEGNLNKEIPILTDRRGGLLSLQRTERRKIYKQFALLMRTLWGMSNILKIEAVKKIYEPEYLEVGLPISSEPDTNSKRKVFVSYTSDDKDVVGELVKKFYYETDLCLTHQLYDYKTGKSQAELYAEDIIVSNTTEIKSNSDASIIVLSLSSMQKPYCVNELAVSLERYSKWKDENIDPFGLYFILVGFEDFLSQTTDFNQTVDTIISIYKHLVKKSMDNEKTKSQFIRVKEIIEDTSDNYFKKIKDILSATACICIKRPETGQPANPDFARHVINKLIDFLQTSNK